MKASLSSRRRYETTIEVRSWGSPTTLRAWHLHLQLQGWYPKKLWEKRNDQYLGQILSKRKGFRQEGEEKLTENFPTTSRKHLSSLWECSLLFAKLPATSSNSFRRHLASSLAALASSRARFIISSAFLSPSSRSAFSRAASFWATVEEAGQRKYVKRLTFRNKRWFWHVTFEVALL